MKIRTRELIIRLTAAGIGFVLTGTVLHIAVAQSHDATIVAQATCSGHYQMCAKVKEFRLMGRSTPTNLLPGELD